MRKPTHQKKDRVAEALERVGPADAWEMMMNTGGLEVTLLQHSRNYAIDRVLEKHPNDYSTAEMYSYLLVWVAGRALISGSRGSFFCWRSPIKKNPRSGALFSICGAFCYVYVLSITCWRRRDRSFQLPIHRNQQPDRQRGIVQLPEDGLQVRQRRLPGRQRPAHILMPPVVGLYGAVNSLVLRPAFPGPYSSRGAF